MAGGAVYYTDRQGNERVGKRIEILETMFHFLLDLVHVYAWRRNMTMPKVQCGPC
jgi:hypothetical protein